MAFNYIGLNVGGKVYMTSRTTLTRYPDSFFAVLLSDRFESALDDRGNYLIDRDGKLFRHILNFMRNERLVLPEGFNEFSLLECEADFFQLGTLKQQLQLYSVSCKNIGLNVGGKIYQTTRETLTREPDSYFTALLSGESPIPRDAHGNILIDRDGDIFCHVLNYLRSFYIQPIGDTAPTAQIMSLQNEAEYYRLSILKEHTIALKVLFNDRHSMPVNTNRLFFYDDIGACTMYTKREGFIPAGHTSLLPLHGKDFHTICGDVRGVSFTLDKDRAGATVHDRLAGNIMVEFEYPANNKDLAAYLSRRFGINLRNERQITSHCTTSQF